VIYRKEKQMKSRDKIYSINLLEPDWMWKPNLKIEN